MPLNGSDAVAVTRRRDGQRHLPGSAKAALVPAQELCSHTHLQPSRCGKMTRRVLSYKWL